MVCRRKKDVKKIWTPKNEKKQKEHQQKNKSQKEKCEHWLDHIKNWKESGLSKAEYCRRTGIRYGKFKW